VFFGALFGLAVWRDKTVAAGIFGCLGLIGAVLAIFPSRTGFLYRGWLRVAHGVGRVITLLILALAYYLVITPAALLKRLFSGRPLPLKPDRKAATYWVERTEPAQPKERFVKRY
jgi:ABC-type Fe3+ transport system permease subunit